MSSIKEQVYGGFQWILHSLSYKKQRRDCVHGKLCKRKRGDIIQHRRKYIIVFINFYGIIYRCKSLKIYRMFIKFIKGLQKFAFIAILRHTFVALCVL